MRLRQYSIRTEHTYLYWIRFFIRFNRLQHPSMLGPTEVKALLSYLASQRQVSANTQKVALNALQFLYGKFLKTPLGELNFTLCSRGRYLPAVLTPPEVQAIWDAMHGSTPHKLIIQLLYGTGMRVSECLRLRIQDIDFGRNLIVIHDGKGKKDRTTLLPGALRAALGAQIAQATLVHQQDLALGVGPALPLALSRKYPNAWRQPGWGFVFPASGHCSHPYVGGLCRYHLHQTAVRKALKHALALVPRLHKRVSCHTFRHCFASQLLASG
nr:integron integrase [Gallaecimonas xiamenensis]